MSPEEGNKPTAFSTLKICQHEVENPSSRSLLSVAILCPQAMTSSPLFSVPSSHSWIALKSDITLIDSRMGSGRPKLQSFASWEPKDLSRALFTKGHHVSCPLLLGSSESPFRTTHEKMQVMSASRDGTRSPSYDSMKKRLSGGQSLRQHEMMKRRWLLTTRL